MISFSLTLLLWRKHLNSYLAKLLNGFPYNQHVISQRPSILVKYLEPWICLTSFYISDMKYLPLKWYGKEVFQILVWEGIWEDICEDSNGKVKGKILRPYCVLAINLNSTFTSEKGYALYVGFVTRILTCKQAYIFFI